MSEKKSELPYQALGKYLKRTREKLQESLAEVSGAVEIEIETLSSIESGISRPSEDILLLMISHFGIKDSEATKLLELAGYDNQLLSLDNLRDTEDADKSSVMVMPVDARISYTDMVHVMVNNYGVIMNFMQSSGPNNQPLAVARVGMSREHAKSVLEVMQRTLAQSEQKSLPAPDTSSDQKSNTKDI